MLCITNSEYFVHLRLFQVYSHFHHSGLGSCVFCLCCMFYYVIYFGVEIKTNGNGNWLRCTYLQHVCDVQHKGCCSLLIFHSYCVE